MEPFSALLAFCAGNSPVTQSFDVFVWSGPVPTDEQTMETPMIWDAIALIMTSL